MRQPGYYWIKLTQFSPWTVGMWILGSPFRSISDHWLIPGKEGAILNEELFKIGETKLIDPITTIALNKVKHLNIDA
jgi:hypothetical protein